MAPPPPAPAREEPELDLDFEAVHEILTRLELQAERAQRRAEWKIKVDAGLSDKVFWELRPELPRLHTMFLLYDADHSGFLSPEEVRILLKHIGLQPYSPVVSKVVEGVFNAVKLEGRDTGGDLDFAKFIDLMDALRAHQQSTRKKLLQQQFKKFDKDKDGYLSPEEMVDALAVAGIVRNRDQKFRALCFGEALDTDGSALLNFEEFEGLAQQMVESENSIRVERDLELGKRLGFQMDQMASYQWAFDHLDADGSGALSLEEVEMALRVFMIRMPNEWYLKKIFASLNKNDDGDIEFAQFLHLMRQVIDQKGVFSQEEPFTLVEVPAEKQRDILRLFPLAESYIRNLELGQLLETVSNFLGVQADENLKHLEEPVKNVRQLIEFARKQAKSK